MSTSLKITLFTAEGWTQVQVSYIISARQEINMGSYIIGTLQ